MSWKNIKRVSSKDDNVLKYVFENDTAVAEAVLYKYPTYEDRTVICCSTMSGCPIGCRFCGAGDNFVRSLSGQEIVDQVTHLFSDRGIDPAKCKRLQVMFMSMGEPMLNMTNLMDAMKVMHKLWPNAALLVSTSGPDVDYTAFRNISMEIDKIGLQFSVHESTDEARNNLVPFKRKLDLAGIAEEGKKWFLATGRQPFFNYCAHPDNTSVDDVSRLLKLFDPEIWQATISVVCERDEHIAAANERQRDLATRFMSMMVDSGYSVRMFDPAGQDDIGGGCGQLWFVQEWMRKNPSLARPSVGRGLPIIHTPRKE